MLMYVYVSLDVCVGVQCILYNEQCTYACVYILMCVFVSRRCTMYTVYCS